MSKYPTKVHHVTDTSIHDPESRGDIALSIYRDPVSGGTFGIDHSYLERAPQSVHVISPFSGQLVELIGGPYGR